MTDDVSPATKSALNGTVLALLGIGGVVIVILVIALFFREEDQRVEDVVQEQESIGAVTETSLNPGWKSPAADSDPSDLIPQAFGGWNLETSDENARNPAFGLTRDGYHGKYTRAGEAIFADLYVYPSEENDAATLDDIRERLSDSARFGDVRFREPALVPGATTLQFDMAPGAEAAAETEANDGVPESHGLLAAVDGWLLFVRSEREDDLLPFLASYMKTVEADGAGEAPPAPAPGDRTEALAD
ncbi:hypothetical protein [Alienimonas chondri]|uniref:Uncharacterized protein n=1 Tax=Alienimonas chondri TaxID=2681879 RepID=A0ABX1VFX4_9PLAN|nr:hypothetical protein [Alienimonas chondri]NNJ26644.1 hypothetical protein [Alienimonas chondri]